MAGFNGTISVHWWHTPPYLTAKESSSSSSSAAAATGGGQQHHQQQQQQQRSWNASFTGVLVTLLEQAFLNCGVSSAASASGGKPHPSISTQRVDNPRAFESISVPTQDDRGTLKLLMPFCTDVSMNSLIKLPFLEEAATNYAYHFLPVIESPGAVHFYRQSEEPVGSDLLTVILQGWPMLIIIVLGAGYSGIIIWLLDRLWNPSNFPKPFLRGFWEGFWWAFVTMTTVGYGDTTPRSFQARMYGLIWIVIGVTILSVFTATVTTVLTQESMGDHHTVLGMKVGVVDGTEEYSLVIKEGGEPVGNVDVDGVFAQGRRLEVDSMILDQYSFAAQQDLLDKEFVIEKRLEHPVLYGFMLIAPPSRLVDCLRREVQRYRGEAFREVVKLISPLTTRTTNAVESTQDLFQPSTIEYMWIGLGAWLVLFVAFIVWEFAYWRPKHRRRKEMKARRAKVLGGIDNPDPVQSNLGLDCLPPRIPIDSRLPRTNFSNANNVSSSWQSCFFPNKGLEPDASSVYAISGSVNLKAGGGGLGGGGSSTSGRISHDELAEVSSLESLIRRQTEEIGALEEELEIFKYHWDTRVAVRKRGHREERRKLLRLIDHADNVHNDTRRTGHSRTPDRATRPKLNNTQRTEDVT